MVRVVALAMCTLVGTVAAQGAADEDRAAAKRELLRERASRRLEEHVDPAGWGGADVGWDAAFFAEPVPVVLGQPMVDNLFINPYPFYSFDATAGQQFHIGVNDISVGDTALWIYDTDRTTLLADYDMDNCGVSMTGSACFESVDCAPTSPLCGGYAEEAVFTAPADGTYYAMGHSLSVYGSSGFDYRVFAPGGAYQYNGPYDTLAADADITDLAGLSLTVHDTWPGGPPPPPPPPPPPYVRPDWNWDLNAPALPPSPPAQKIGSGRPVNGRPLRMTSAQTVDVGGGMTCKKMPAGSGQRYVCNY